MTTLTEGVHPAESLISEANGDRSRAAITVADGSVVTACMVLGAVETGVPTATAGTPVSTTNGTVGNGTLSAIVAAAGAMAGIWHIEITGTDTNAGEFLVRRPDGTVDGTGTVAVEYDEGVTFTLADGANDWLAGDVIPFTVEYQDGESALKYEPYDQDGTDGSEVAAGIAYGDYDGTDADVPGVAWVRDCVHNADIVVWPTDITADEKAVAIQQMEARGIILR